MKRKVNLVGMSTLTVSLPSKWAKKNQIKKGDELDVAEEENSLIIVYGNKTSPHKKEAEVNLEGMGDDAIRLVLNNLFRSGVDILKVSFKDPKQFENIRKVSDMRFIGFEITKRERDYCVLENVTVPDSSKFDTLYRRAFLIVNETISIILEDLKGGSFTNMLTISHQFEKVEQYLNFCMRIINNEEIQLNDPNFHFVVLYLLRVLEGSLERLYETLAEHKKTTIEKDIIDYFEQLQRVYNRFYQSFYNKDIDELAKLNEEVRDPLFKEGYRLMAKKRGLESLIVHHMIDVTRYLSLIMSPTLKIVL